MAAIRAGVRVVARDGLRAIAASFTARRIPASWLQRLAPGGRLRTTITTGAPGWQATALVHRDEHGASNPTASSSAPPNS
ncbi:hypothetical protein PUR61_17025 [Streptomyces sp. BE20]|uniref:hypothetical protein n=1 Tax=Streptomyces sp. BE20 TaxID=3002525 RepID=UPI002E76D7F0|nr:hypothetical protein [Streptomyces sp. BE20]MEE1823881.1 hypothetical protein [Streptomyces sp. BE20]